MLDHHSSERTPTWQATEWPADQGPVTEEAPAGPHLILDQAQGRPALAHLGMAVDRFAPLQNHAALGCPVNADGRMVAESLDHHSSERTPTWQATEWPADQGPV
jgi:adenosyl cobinamide kinase/adenosyl cobinamide phosphate guanylyltransferase